MGQKYQTILTKLNCAIVMGVGTFISLDSSALAQVGVRSRINAPTSINITPPPGSHIPLPDNYDYYRGSSDRYGDSSRYYDPWYDDDHYYEHRTYRHRRNQPGNIIIINLPNREYERNDTYIRVIRRQ
ncbi:hypothetical protein NIES4102_04250 [Chondrocystis sp. NIES-4102]|nr:hypothetical protein NIES4102_04250 [Chondrocystis sp. NIES-4102]